jgi:hypothetical protein
MRPLNSLGAGMISPEPGGLKLRSDADFWPAAVRFILMTMQAAIRKIQK